MDLENPPRGSVAWWMDRRRNELDLRWEDVYAPAGITNQTLINIRLGKNARSRSKRKVERQLQWEPGSLDDIAAGGSPTPLDSAGTTEGTSAITDRRLRDDPVERAIWAERDASTDARWASIFRYRTWLFTSEHDNDDQRRHPDASAG
jgi:hypothetical protein